MSSFGVKTAALNLLSDWMKSLEHDQVTNARTSTSMTEKTWIKPPKGWVKINVDGALFEEVKNIE